MSVLASQGVVAVRRARDSFLHDEQVALDGSDFEESRSGVMKLNLAYGQGHLPVELPEERTTVIEPSHVPGLADERGAVFAALENPIGARPLRDWIKPGAKICIGQNFPCAPAASAASAACSACG